MEKVDGNVHVIPLDKHHEESKDCWCVPTLTQKIDEAHDKEVWLHKELQ